MSKKSPRTISKDNAWKSFSLYIRTRDSIKTTGEIDTCICVTCPNEYPRLGIGCIQAGHWLPGRSNAVLFSEEGVHGQCWQCNHHKKGAPKEYLEYMQENYSQEVINRLLKESHEIVVYKKHDFDAIDKKYKEMTQKLLDNV